MSFDSMVQWLFMQIFMAFWVTLQTSNVARLNTISLVTFIVCKTFSISCIKETFSYKQFLVVPKWYLKTQECLCVKTTWTIKKSSSPASPFLSYICTKVSSWELHNFLVFFFSFHKYELWYFHIQLVRHHYFTCSLLWELFMHFYLLPC